MKSLSQNHIPRSLTSLRARQPNDFSCNQNKHHRQQLQIQQNPNGLVNTSNISSGSNNLIQSNSIQNQFTALSNQKEAFVSENNLAKKELQQIQKEHQSVNMEHDHLIELGRQAKERLGQGMEKLGILKEQEARILQLTKNEFRAIHDCTNHSNLLDRIKQETSEKYSGEMDPLNFELATLLEGRLQNETKRCLSLRSIEAIVLPEIDKASKEQNRPQLLSEKENIYHSIGRLQEATAQRKEIIAHLRYLYGTLVQQRKYGSTEGNLHRLENRVTVSTRDIFETETNKEPSKHMDLFYGPPCGE